MILLGQLKWQCRNSFPVQGSGMEINKIIDLIRDLTKKTVRNGCTEAEAFSAATKIGELLKVYNLSMDKVFLGETKCLTGEVDTGRQSRHPIDGCLIAIAEFCDCFVWHHKEYKANSSYKFFGLETDVEMVKYLYSMILQAIETETGKFKLAPAYVNADMHRKRLTSSFQKGMVGRISSRLSKMTRQRQNEETEEEILVPNGTSTQTSLIVVKRNKVKDEYEKLSLGLRKHQSVNHRIHLSAYDAGKAAGEKINLNRPINVQVAGYLQ